MPADYRNHKLQLGDRVETNDERIGEIVYLRGIYYGVQFADSGIVKEFRSMSLQYVPTTEVIYRTLCPAIQSKWDRHTEHSRRVIKQSYSGLPEWSELEVGDG